MITLVEAKNFKCLKDTSQPLESFRVLVGPNASGKSTFLEVVAFLGDLVSGGLEAAVFARTENFEDLVFWRSTDKKFELGIEAKIPENLRGLIRKGRFDTIRYEVAIGVDPHTKEVSIFSEKVLMKLKQEPETGFLDLFPREIISRETILTPDRMRNTQTTIKKVSGGNDNYYPEVSGKTGKGWTLSVKLGPRESALKNLPADASKYPISTWLKKLLSDGIQHLVLNSLLIRKASPSGKIRGFKPDGSNLPWVIHQLVEKEPQTFRDWIEHLQTALPDLEGIRTIEREDDKHRYLKLCYQGGIEVPSWMASDGTLRLLALTLPAYLKDFSGIYLIEEPENGIHPQAVATMIQSLSSVYNAQVLLATHSPVILGMTEADKVLCFAKTSQGATDIVLGRDHPALKNWRGEVNLGVLFAAGVLG